MDLVFVLGYFFIMISAGILGGVINYFFQSDQEKSDVKRPNLLLKCITIGIGASLVVPLFLEIIQSDLIKNNRLDNSKMFIFMGFCLLASIYSRKFLLTISERVIKDVKVAKEKAIEVEKRLDSREEQHSADSKIIAILEQLFIEDPAQDNPGVSVEQLKESIISSSEYSKAVIYSKSRTFRLQNFKNKSRIERLIPIFETLIECDEENIYHRNHGELAYILKDMKKPDYKRALSELNKAIEIRDNREIGNYTAYEFNRAICRIHLSGEKSDTSENRKAQKEMIIRDLKIAAENNYWRKALKAKKLKDGSTALADWLKQNRVSISSLIS